MYTLLMLLELTGEVWGWGNVGQGGPIFSAVARLTFLRTLRLILLGGVFLRVRALDVGPIWLEDRD